MIFNGSNKIGKLHLANEIGKMYVGDALVFENYSGPRFRDYTVGDIVPIPYNGGLQHCVVVHQGNPDSTIYDASCNGTWLMFLDTQSSAATNVEYYTQSDIKSTLMPSVFNTFDDDIKGKIKTVKIPCVNREEGNVVSYTGASGIEANVFSLSMKEAGYTATTNNDVGVKLDYFTQGNDSAANAVRNRYTASTSWHTRGFFNDGTDKAAVSASAGGADPEGAASGSATVNVRPAFIVKGSAPSIDTSSLTKITGTSGGIPNMTFTIGGKSMLEWPYPYYFSGDTITISGYYSQSTEIRVYIYLNGNQVLYESMYDSRYHTDLSYTLTPTANEYTVSMTSQNKYTGGEEYSTQRYTMCYYIRINEVA